MRVHCAFRFAALLDEVELRTRWTEVAGLDWIERDNDEWGEYAMAMVRAPALRARVRLFCDEAWCADIEVVGRTADVEGFVARIRDEILPAVGAREIRGAETYDTRAPLELDPVDTLVEYLRSRDSTGLEQEIAQTVGLTRGEPEARMFLAWCAGHDRIAAEGVHGFEGRPVWLGPLLPAHAAPGDLWFDVCELAAMVRLQRSWLSLDLVDALRLRAFIALAELVPRRAQLAAPRRTLDPERFVALDPRRRIDAITQGEATLYAWWFGKRLPHRFDYQEAALVLPTEPRLGGLAAPFHTTEWTSSRIAGDERARVLMRASWLDDDPEVNAAMVRDAADAPPEVYVRTSVPVELGLLASIAPGAPELVLAEDSTLRTVLDRHAFRRA